MPNKDLQYRRKETGDRNVITGIEPYIKKIQDTFVTS